MHELYVSPDPCLLVLLFTAWADIEAPGRLLKLAECSKGVPGGRIEVKNARMLKKYHKYQGKEYFLASSKLLSLKLWQI